MSDYAAILLLGSAQETRDIHKSDYRNIECITEADETGSLT